MSNNIAPSDSDRDATLLRILRTTLDDDTYRERMGGAVAYGYKVLSFEKAGALVAALGYRVTFDPCWCKALYVDDLVVASELRVGGHGGTLHKAAKAVADNASRDFFRLCSEFNWIDAHRFYVTNVLSGFRKQFILPLKGT